MRYPAPVWLSLAVALASPAWAAAPICTSAPPQPRLCVQNGAEGGQVWWLQGDGSEPKGLQAPQVAMAQVTGLASSAGGRWLAVESVGEGHPILDLFSLHDVLAGRGPEPVRSINPFPGGITLIGWADEHLHVESDRLLTLDPLPFGVEPELEQAVRFSLDPSSGRFDRLP